MMHASTILKKLTIETAMNSEFTDLLDMKNSSKSGFNTRNGYSSKNLLINDSAFKLTTLHDRKETVLAELRFWLPII